MDRVGEASGISPLPGLSISWDLGKCLHEPTLWQECMLSPKKVNRNDSQVLTTRSLLFSSPQTLPRLIWSLSFHAWLHASQQFFPPHKRRDSVEIHFRGRQECNNETFFALKFKMPISTLKFKFSIKFAFALYLDSPEWTVQGLLICFCSLFFRDS